MKRLNLQLSETQITGIEQLLFTGLIGTIIMFFICGFSPEGLFHTIVKWILVIWGVVMCGIPWLIMFILWIRLIIENILDLPENKGVNKNDSDRL